jgi:hypothetical protein
MENKSADKFSMVFKMPEMSNECCVNDDDDERREFFR